MKTWQPLLKLILGLMFCCGIALSEANAQYYPSNGGYGRGGYGRGGYGNTFGDFDNGKPKPPPDPDEVAKEETEWMVKKLKLTDEQEIIISSLNEDYAYQRKDLFELIKKDFGTTVQPTPKQISDAKDKMAALEARKDAELKKILTEEQFTIYQDKKKGTKKGPR